MPKEKPKTDEDKQKWPKNLYKRGESWIVDFFCRGHRYTENIGPVTRTQAKQKRDTMKGDAAAARLDIGPPVEDLTFDKVSEKYLEWYKANKKPNSYIRHKCSGKHLTAFFGEKRLSLISTFLVDSYKLKRKAAGAQHATVNRELAMLRNLFNKAIGWRFAKTNPCKGVALFKENNSRNRYLTEEEGTRLLSHCSGNLRLLVLLAMHTGFRASELRSLRWSHVDFRNTSVTVDSGYSKNAETRSVPMTADLEAALRAEYDRRKKPAQDEAVLLSNDGTAWKDWRSAYKLALKKAGITDFTFHDLRHCFGSYLGMNNTNQKAMMELMGHKRPEMTMRYTHLSLEYKRQAVSMLPSFSGAEKVDMESQQKSQQVPLKKVAKIHGK